MQPIITDNKERLYVLTESEYASLVGDKMINLTECAKMWGLSPNRLSEQPWLLPPHRKREHNQMYLKTDIERMIAIGREELKRQWLEQQKMEKMSKSMKKLILKHLQTAS